MSSANDDAKVDQDVLDILEKETKEHDKVCMIITTSSGYWANVYDTGPGN